MFATFVLDGIWGSAPSVLLSLIGLGWLRQSNVASRGPVACEACIIAIGCFRIRFHSRHYGGNNSGGVSPLLVQFVAFSFGSPQQLDHGFSIGKSLEDVGFAVVHGDFDTRRFVGMNFRYLKKR